MAQRCDLSEEEKMVAKEWDRYFMSVAAAKGLRFDIGFGILAAELAADLAASGRRPPRREQPPETPSSPAGLLP